MCKTTTIKSICVLLILLLAQNALAAESRRRTRDSWAQMRRLAAEDHKRMMDLLGIKSLRPGRNGMDPNADNAEIPSREPKRFEIVTLCVPTSGDSSRGT